MSKIEQLLDHKFTNQNLLKQALTHASAGEGKNYERLEFLGDRVLGLAVAHLLYKSFPNEPEGDLAKRLAALASGAFLAARAREIGLGEHIYFSDAERAAGGEENDHILADVFESLIGALYLETGFEKCQAFIEKHWASRLDEMAKPPQHPKTALQEWAQSKGLPVPSYNIAGQSGPDHAPTFEIEVSVEGYQALRASGPSRQRAEKEAAAAFLKKIENK